MSNRNYIKGRKAEYKTQEYLEKQGYLTQRTAGSHTPIDIRADLSTKVDNLNFLPIHLAVQVKKNTPPTKEDKLKLEKYPLPADILKVIYFWKKRARKPTIIEVSCVDF